MKKVVIAAVVLFLGFWMVTNPRSLADTSQDAGGQAVSMTGDFFEAVIDFAGELGE
jgi:hypothetical protein